MMHVPCFYINYWIICWPSRSFHTLSIVIIKSVSVFVRLGHKLPTLEKMVKFVFKYSAQTKLLLQAP